MDTERSLKLRKDDDEGINLGGLFASKKALVPLVALLGAGGLSLAEPDQGSMLSGLQSYSPAIISLAGSFLAGLIIGRIARRQLKPVIIVGGIVVVAITLLTKFGVIGPTADQWVHSSVGWVSDQFDSVQAYIAALLPSATAAGSGLYLGFRRKRKS